MIVKVSDLSAEVRVLEYREDAQSINRLVEAAPGWVEQYVENDLAVRAEIYRHGGDVTFAGSLSATVRAVCPRCLDEFRWLLERRFEFLIVRCDSGNAEDDTGLAHYAGDEIDLGPLVREQAVLGLDQ